MLENVRKCWKMLENVGKCWKMVHVTAENQPKGHTEINTLSTDQFLHQPTETTSPFKHPNFAAECAESLREIITEAHQWLAIISFKHHYM